jgi:hypothetical protein
MSDKAVAGSLAIHPGWSARTLKMVLDGALFSFGQSVV